MFPRSNRRRFECVVPNLNLTRSTVTGGSPVTDLSQDRRTVLRCTVFVLLQRQGLNCCQSIHCRRTFTVSIIPASVGLFTKIIVVSNNYPVNSAVAAGHISALHACTCVSLSDSPHRPRDSALVVCCAHSRFSLAGRCYICTIGYSLCL